MFSFPFDLENLPFSFSHTSTSILSIQLPLLYLIQSIELSLLLDVLLHMEAICGEANQQTVS